MDICPGVYPPALPVAVRCAGDRGGDHPPRQAGHRGGAHGSLPDHSRPHGGGRAGWTGRLAPPPAAAAGGRCQHAGLGQGAAGHLCGGRRIHRRGRPLRAEADAECPLLPAAADLFHAGRTRRLLPVTQLVRAVHDRQRGTATLVTYLRGAIGLVMIIVIAALLNIGIFHFGAHPRYIVYLATYLVVMIGTVGILWWNHRETSRAAITVGLPAPAVGGL